MKKLRQMQKENKHNFASIYHLHYGECYSHIKNTATELCFVHVQYNTIP